jgi:hypothetical protein
LGGGLRGSVWVVVVVVVVKFAIEVVVVVGVLKLQYKND